MSIGVPESGTEGNGGNGSLPQAGFAAGGAFGQDNPFHVLWRGRWIFVLSLVAAAAAAYLYLQWTTPLYVSTARLLIERPRQHSTWEVPPPPGSTSVGYVHTQAALISSREIVTAAMRDPNVLTLPTFRSRAYPIEEVIRTLSVSVAKNTDIVSITAQSAYPDDAAQIVNAVVRAYIQWHKDNRKSTTADLLKDLNNQCDKRFDELQAARNARREFERKNPEFMERIRGGTVLTTLEEFKKDLDAARENIRKQDSFYAGLKKFEFDAEGMRGYVYSHRDSAAMWEEEGERARFLEELSAIELRLITQLAIGGSIREASLLEKRAGQIQQVLEELDKVFVQNQISVAKIRMDEERAREKQLTDRYERESENVRRFNGLETEYKLVNSQCDELQAIYDSLKKQIEAMDPSTNIEGLKIHVLETALPATEPFSPQLTQVVGGALALGLIAGAGLAFLRDWRRQRMHSADEITVMLGAPILGAVPSMAKHGFAARAQRLWLASGSAESEAYRSIRTALFFGAGQKAATILVTSPDRMEGKTTLVSNLGIAMAQAGQKTLILDADLRKPMQHRAFSFKRHDGGLTDVLMGAMPLEQAIRPTPVPGLDILTGGEGVSNPSELLGSRTFARLLGQLQGMYDRILVDSPPVAMVTDAQILATYCSVTLLVLRAQTSSRMATQRAKDALLTVHARLGGIVLNDVPRRDSRYNYRGKYGGRNGDRQRIGVLPVEIGPLPEHTPAGVAQG